MEVHKLYDADTGALLGTYKSAEEILEFEQTAKKKSPSTVLLKRIENVHDDDFDVYYLYRDDVKLDENPTELIQPPTLQQLMDKDTVKPSELTSVQQLHQLANYYASIKQIGTSRANEVKRLMDLCMRKRSSLSTLVLGYMVNVLKDYEKRYNAVKDVVDQTNVFCDTYLQGGLNNLVHSLQTTKCTHSGSDTSLLDFISRIDQEYSEEGLQENYKNVQQVLTTSKTTIEMQHPALKFCHSRVKDYITQLEQSKELAQQWRDLLFRANDVSERQDAIMYEFEESKKVLLNHLQNASKDSQLLAASAQSELNSKQIEKKLIALDEEMREVLWKSIDLSVKENNRIKMEPMMKLRQRMAQFLAMLDGVHQTVQKTLGKGALARIKFAYHLPAIYPLCIAEVLRRKDFKKIMRIELDNLLEVLESAFRGENAERIKYEKQLKLKIGEDDAQRDILDALIPGLLEKINDVEIMSEYRKLKEKTLDIDTRLPQQVDASNKEDAEFVFVEESVSTDQKKAPVATQPRKNFQEIAQDMGATQFFDQVLGQGKEIKDMVNVVNQHEKQRQQQLLEKKQKKLEELKRKAVDVGDSDPESDDEEPQQAFSVKTKQAEEVEKLRSELEKLALVKKQTEEQAEEKQAMINSLDEHVVDLTSHTDKLRQELAIVSEKLEKTAAEKNTLEKQQAALAEELTVTRKNMETLKQSSAQQVKEAREENEMMKKSLESKQGAAKEIMEKMQQQSIQFKSESMQLEEEIGSLKRQTREAVQEKSVLTQKLRDLEQIAERKSNDIERIQKELERSKQQVTSAEETITQSQRETKLLRDKVAALERENKILLEEKEVAQQQLQQTGASNADHVRKQEQIRREMSAQLHELEAANQELQSRLAQSASEIKKGKVSSEGYQNQIEELHNKLAIREKEIKKLNAEKQEVTERLGAEITEIRNLRNKEQKRLMEQQKQMDEMVEEYEQKLLEARKKVTSPIVQQSPLVQSPVVDAQSTDLKIQHLSDLVSNSTKVIANLNNRAAVWDKCIDALKKQFAHTMTHRMTALSEASRKLSERQAQVNNSGSSFQLQNQVFRLNLIQQGKIVRETIAEYMDVFATLSNVSPLVSDLVDYSKQSLGDMDQIMTQCELICREEVDNAMNNPQDMKNEQLHQQYQQQNERRTVVLDHFVVDDRIVFFRSQRNNELWEAFNVGNPNFFLSPETVMSLKHKMGNHYQQTHVSIGIAVQIEKCNCAENNINPLKLSGPYHLITAVLE
jgi:hypothetical protein